MTGTVRSIDRCFDILEMLMERGREMSLAEISRTLGAPKSTVLTIVRTLVARGLLAPDEQRKVYRLGLGFARFYSSRIEPLPLQEIARPELHKLTLATGETSTLAIVEGHSVFYSCAIQGEQAIQYVVPVGVPRPLHCTASGKLALAQLDPQELRTYVRKAGLARFTPRTITRLGALKEELDAIRGQDYATSIGELSADLFGIATPIHDHQDRLIASVNLAGPIFRLGDRMPRLVQAAQLAAAQISMEVRRVGAALVIRANGV